MTSRPDKNTTDSISMPTEAGPTLLMIADIKYVEAVDNFTYFFMKDGEKLVFATPIGRVEEMLDGCGFFRPNWYFLVNKAAVRAYIPLGEAPHLELVNGGHVPVSRRNRTRLAELFLQNTES